MAIYTSILTGGSNNHETTSEAANGAQTDLIGEGVVGVITNTGGVAPATGAFAVNAQGTPAMAVDVSAGLAYVTATPTGQNSQSLRIRNTATASVSISANSTGSTKYDWIYLAVDATKAANPAVDGDDVASIVVSRSTSSASDDGTPPTYAILLAKVTVANGASSITDANITDARNNITVPVASVDTAQIVAGAVDTTQLADSAVTSAKLALGTPVQMVMVNYSSGATGTTTIPLDGSIPQNNEGSEFMTLNITPKSASNILCVEVVFVGSLSSSPIDLAVALFRDSGANALAASLATVSGTNYRVIVPLGHMVVAGSTSETTFKVRAGAVSAATLTFNGAGGNAYFGTATKSYIKVTEYKAS